MLSDYCRHKYKCVGAFNYMLTAEGVGDFGNEIIKTDGVAWEEVKSIAQGVLLKKSCFNLR